MHKYALYNLRVTSFNFYRKGLLLKLKLTGWSEYTSCVSSSSHWWYCKWSSRSLSRRLSSRYKPGRRVENATNIISHCICVAAKKVHAIYSQDLLSMLNWKVQKLMGVTTRLKYVPNNYKIV